MSLRQHKELGDHSKVDSQGSRFTGWLLPLASARSHCLPGGENLQGVQLFNGSDFTLEPDSNNSLPEFSNSVLDNFRMPPLTVEVKRNDHGLTALVERRRDGACRVRLETEHFLSDARLILVCQPLLTSCQLRLHHV
jgi:hypothetical protein